VLFCKYSVQTYRGKDPFFKNFRVSIIELESLCRPNSNLNLVSESGELGLALDRKVLFSVSV
jgi:hypothetical protein